MEIAIYPNREPLHRLKLRIFHILALLASLLVCSVNIAQMESDNSYHCEFHTSMTTWFRLRLHEGTPHTVLFSSLSAHCKHGRVLLSVLDWMCAPIVPVNQKTAFIPKWGIVQRLQDTDGVFVQERKTRLGAVFGIYELAPGIFCWYYINDSTAGKGDRDELVRYELFLPHICQPIS